MFKSMEHILCPISRQYVPHEFYVSSQGLEQALRDSSTILPRKYMEELSEVDEAVHRKSIY
ncbi:hypothetical protein [Vibrio splendidus]|uniref:hypothetical protein n=1 Tax=Vibrio splendidus TaxID=29497 RepID=UPI0002E44395|nr:hypothetical protein [Vibrio splendidus]